MPGLRLARQARGTEQVCRLCRRTSGLSCERTGGTRNRAIRHSWPTEVSAEIHAVSRYPTATPTCTANRQRADLSGHARPAYLQPSEAGNSCIASTRVMLWSVRDLVDEQCTNDRSVEGVHLKAGTGPGCREMCWTCGWLAGLSWSDVRERY
jgi:hypothetical protein